MPEWLLGYGGSMTILAIYLLVMLTIGLWAWRRFPPLNLEGFILGGRAIGWLVVAATVMATQYSALMFLGFPGLMYRTGVGGYVALAWQFQIIAMFVWIFFAARVWKLGRAHGHMTPSDTLSHYFQSNGVGYIAAVLLLIAMIPYIMVQITGVGYLLQIGSGGAIPFEVGAVAIYVVVLLYTVLGGIRSVAWTDVLQGVMTFLGLVVGGVVVAHVAAGGISNAFQSIADSNPDWLTLPGPNNAWAWPWLITWSITLALGWTMHPHMWLRWHVPKHITSVRLWPIWLALSQAFLLGAGLLVAAAGQVAMPGLTTPEETDTIMIRMILQYVPPVVGGVIVAAGIAAMMSSLDSLVHGVAAVATRDLILKWVPRLSASRQVLAGRIAVAVVAMIGLILSLTTPAFLITIGALAAALGAQILPAVAAALTNMRWVTKYGTMAGIVVGAAITLYIGIAVPGAMVAGIYGGFLGLLANIVVTALVSLATQAARVSKETAKAYDYVGW